MLNQAGNWWNDRDIELVEIDGRVFALNGWNGEKWCDCWECSGEHNMTASEEEYTITPIYAEPSEEDQDEIEQTGYDVTPN